MNKIFLQGSNPVGQDDDRVKIRYQQASPPAVKIEKPSSDPHQTSKSKIAIKGEAMNVSGPQELTLKDNGQVVQNFQYLQSGRFKYTMTLQPGKNKFSVTALNPAGQASDSRVIHRTTTNYLRGKDDDEKKKEEKVQKGMPEPDVRIESPSSSETTVNGVRVVAQVKNSKKVELFVNGQAQPYSLDGDRLEADVPLKKGKNRIRVRVENEAGSATDKTTIRFEPVKEANPDPEPEKEEEEEDEKEVEKEKEESPEPEKGDDESESEATDKGGQIDDVKKDKEDKDKDPGKKGEQIDDKKDKKH
jgi:hypothetical protein